MLISTFRTGTALCCAIGLLAFACTESSTPTTPTTSANAAAESVNPQTGAAVHLHSSDDKGYIDGWFNGETVQLYYTKSYFCTQLPDSAPDAARCEIGADGEVPPRGGPIPIIYAIAWTGLSQPVQPDPATFACGINSGCLNHPGMIDASRVGGRISINPAAAQPHCHGAPRRVAPYGEHPSGQPWGVESDRECQDARKGSRAAGRRLGPSGRADEHLLLHRVVAIA